VRGDEVENRRGKDAKHLALPSGMHFRTTRASGCANGGSWPSKL
jgi:hypothetical protein